MAPVVQTKGSGGNTSPATATFDTGPTNGNLMVAVVNSDTTVNTPSGWTLRASAVDDQGFYVYQKVAGASESSTFSATTNGNNPWSCAIAEFDQAEVGAFDLQGSVVDTSGNLTTKTCGTITTTGSTGAFVLAVVALHGLVSAATYQSGNPSWDNGFTNLQNGTVNSPVSGSSQAVQCFTGYKALGTDGAVGVTTCTWTSGAENAMSLHIAYQAVSGGSALTASPADDVGVTDSVTATMAHVLTASPADTAGITDTVAVVVDRQVTVGDLLGITDLGGPQQLDIGLLIEESIGVTDTAASTSARALTVADNVGVLDAAGTVADRALTVTDTVGATDATQADKGQLAAVTDTAGITDDAATIADRVVAPADTAGITDSVDTVAVRLLTVTDTTGITDGVSATITSGNNLTADITDTIGLVDAASHTAERSLTVTDTVGVIDAATTAVVRVLTVADLLGVTDTADGQITVGGNALTADISDGVGLTDAAGSTSERALTVADILAVTDTTTTAAVKFLTISDTAGITDAATGFTAGPWPDITHASATLRVINWRADLT